jgi:hypothetical protein
MSLLLSSSASELFAMISIPPSEISSISLCISSSVATVSLLFALDLCLIFFVFRDLPFFVVVLPFVANLARKFAVFVLCNSLLYFRQRSFSYKLANTFT